MKDEIYYKAMRIRMVEEEISRRYADKKMRCPVHLSIGQELNAAVLCEYLTIDDQVVSTHRGHAHYLAKGDHLKNLLQNFMVRPPDAAEVLVALCIYAIGVLGSWDLLQLLGGLYVSALALLFLINSKGKRT